MDNDNKQTTVLDEALKDTNVILEAIKKTSKDDFKQIINEAFDDNIKKNVEDEGDENPELDNKEEIEAPAEEGNIEITDADIDATDVDVDKIGGEDLGTEPEEVIDLVKVDDEIGFDLFKKINDDDVVEIVKDGIKLVNPETGDEYLIKKETLTEGYLDDIDDEVYLDRDIDDSQAAVLDKYNYKKEDAMINDVEKINPEIEEDVDEIEVVIDDDNDNEKPEIEEGAVMGSHTFATGMKAHQYNVDFPEDRERKDLVPEGKVIRLEKQIRRLNETVAKQKDVIKKYESATKTYSQTLSEVHRTHTNLRNFKDLVTEYAMSNKEKQQVLEKLEAAKTAEESMVICETLKKELSGKETQKTIVSESSGSVVEKTSFMAPELQKSAMNLMDRLSKRK